MKPVKKILIATALLAIASPAFPVRTAAADWSALPARATPDWVRECVIYEVFPRQFSPTGDLAGVTARLDGIKALGVDVIWLMPIHPLGRLKAKGSLGSPYAIRDYYAVNPDYGTKEDFRRLVQEAHARGMKVIIDIVANHTAWDSVMMSDPTLYKRDPSGRVIQPHPEWADVAGLDYSNPKTRRYMRDMLVYWAREFELDGFRCDDALDVPTDFWEEVRLDLDKVRPGLFLLAEASKPELLVKAFDMDYGWPMMAALNRVLMDGAPATDICRTWEEAEQRAFPRGALHLHCSDNHDEARAISRYGWNGALAASALMFALDGAPLIYNGMEVGDTTESGDPALFEKVPILWQPKQREFFSETYRRLIELRHRHPALTQGSVVWIENSAAKDVVTLLRKSAGEEILTVVNLSNRPRAASVRIDGRPAFSLLLASGAPGRKFRDAPTDLSLGAFEWRFYSRK